MLLGIDRVHGYQPLPCSVRHAIRFVAIACFARRQMSSVVFARACQSLRYIVNERKAVDVRLAQRRLTYGWMMRACACRVARSGSYMVTLAGLQLGTAAHQLFARSSLAELRWGKPDEASIAWTACASPCERSGTAQNFKTSAEIGYKSEASCQSCKGCRVG
jgi:hypothetical protein